MDYSRLDLLTSISGEKIETVADWETYRREEIMVLLKERWRARLDSQTIINL